MSRWERTSVAKPYAAGKKTTLRFAHVVAGSYVVRMNQPYSRFPGDPSEVWDEDDSESGTANISPRPSSQQKFEQLLELLSDGTDGRYVLAELNDLLSQLAADELGKAVVHADLSRLSAHWMNYIAAMVEQACLLKGVRPPPWTAEVAPLETPYFAVPFKSLCLHLRRASPVPFKRRNIFVDTGIGSRV